MSKSRISVLVSAMLLAAAAFPAIADDVAEKMVDDAMPLMYHSCASVVEENGGDEVEITKIIHSLVAVSLYNHEVDVSQHAKTATEKATLSDRFIEAVGAQCKLDGDALLAGVIDDAVVSALASK